METEKYNGWKNRSTWLAVVHLENTSKEVHDSAVEKAIQANTSKSFKNLIRAVLLDIPELWKEQDFDALRIDFDEIWNRLAGYNK
jgi:hypothetical protein